MKKYNLIYIILFAFIFAEDIDIFSSEEQPITSHATDLFSLFENMITVNLYLALRAG